MKKLLLIANLHSGKGMVRPNLGAIIEVFNNADYEVTVYTTKYSRHATELVSRLGTEYDLIVCSGGDGTLSEVVDGIMTFPEEKRPKIGYIPSGSTNDYASTLRLPQQMKACAELIAGDHFRKVDVGRFQDDYFVYVAAFGAFTEVSWNTPQDEKNLLGHNAYILHGIQELANIRPYRMKITIGDEVLEKEFVYGMIYNANSVGGIRNLSGRPVDLSDGELDIMLVANPETGIEWPALLADFVTKNPNSKYIQSYRASHVSIESEDVIDWTLDGEYGGAHNSVEIDTFRQAMTIAAPEEPVKTVTV